jgi:hypothetical protein
MAKVHFFIRFITRALGRADPYMPYESSDGSDLPYFTRRDRPKLGKMVNLLARKRLVGLSKKSDFAASFSIPDPLCLN